MKLKIHHYLELIGITMVLIATALQLILLNKISDIYNEENLLRIEQKINIIWYELENKTPDNQINYHSKQFNSINNYKIADRLEKQNNFLSYLYGIIMIIGSLIIVAGRFIEIKYENKNERENINK